MSTQKQYSTDNELWPEIDVIIPTLNCEDNLEICLDRIRKQTYDGKINIYVIDGGSKDNTVIIGKKYGANVTLIPDIYSDGVNGAKMVGEMKGNGEYIWHIDSDNFLEGNSVAKALVEPLMNYPDYNISVPFNSKNFEFNKARSKFASYLNSFINRSELERLTEMCMRGVKIGEVYLVDALEYGISNCSLVRRSAESTIGYYDSDVRVLSRLRKKGLAGGVLIPNARFNQYAVTSFKEYVFKMVRRINHLSHLDLNNYFVEGKSVAPEHFKIDLSIHFRNFKRFIRTRKAEDAYFLVSIIASVLIVVISFRRFLRLKGTSK